MMPYVWRRDFKSGNWQIDGLYKEIYELFNIFSSENEKDTTNEAVHKLAKELMSRANSLFSIENELMAGESYPLTNRHASNHLKIQGTLKNMVEASASGLLTTPFKDVIGFAKIWLKDHQAHDDATFYSYCQNKGKDIGSHLINLVCNVTTMKDKFITSGMILSAESHNLRIDLPEDSKLNLVPGDMVKVTAKSKFSRVYTIVALAGNLGNDELSLFNASAVDASNNRAVFRVEAKIKANILAEGKQIPATITNISSGGLLLDAPGPFKIGSFLNLEFMIQNHRIIEPTEVMRIIVNDTGKMFYSLKFVAISSKDQEIIDAYVLNKQIMSVR